MYIIIYHECYISSMRIHMIATIIIVDSYVTEVNIIAR